MRAPKKVIAAMAMATLLGGTGVQAFAAGNQGVSEPEIYEFTQTTGAVNQDSLQKTQKYSANTDDKNQLTSKGQIEINGEFTKYVNPFPAETKDGHYLRVTMPLSLGYSYNVNSNELSTGEGVIRNTSLKIDSSQESNQPVKMTFVKMDQPTNAKYVKDVATADASNLNLPFALVISKNGTDLGRVALADIPATEGQLIDSKASSILKDGIVIDPNNTLKLKFDKIEGQSIGGKTDLLKEGKTTITNAITLKFEYAGK